MTAKKTTPRWKNIVEVFPTADGQFGWHLKAQNGNIRCQGEGHPSRSKATRAVLGVQLAFSNVPANVPIIQLDARP